MNLIQIRKDILSRIYPDFLFSERKSEFITWCQNPDGCNGQHHKRKLQINLEKNIFNCWVCGTSGFILKLLNNAPANLRKQYLGTLPDFRGKENSSVQTISLPHEYHFLLDCLDIPEGNLAYNWIKDNLKIEDDVIYQYKIGFCWSGRYKDRLIFPSFDIHGNLNFFVTRSIFSNTSFKYLNCEGVGSKDIIFNEILIDWNKPLILVEGIKSHLKFHDIPNVTPILGSRFTKNYKLFQESILNDVKIVYIALDDEARTKSYDIIEFYNSCGTDVRLVSLTNINQPDKLTKEEFLDRIYCATQHDKSSLLKEKLQLLRIKL